MRGRTAAHRDTPDNGDSGDPFSLPARSRLQSPSRAAVPSAIEDRDSLRALFECTRGRSWRTSLGWPSWGGVPRTPRNPFGEAHVAARNVDDTKRRPTRAAAAAADGAGSGCSTPQRTTDGGGSPGNPFARAVAVVQSGNPFAPPTPTIRTSFSKTSASPPADDGAANTRRATEMLVSPLTGSASPIGTPTAMRRATGVLPSPPHGAHPLAAAANARQVQNRHPSASPPADSQTRSALLSPPRQRNSRSVDGAGAAWFGVSLGTAARVTELRLVDNGLVGTLPSALGGLEVLRYLHLGRNALSGGLSATAFSVGMTSFSSKPFPSSHRPEASFMVVR